MSSPRNHNPQHYFLQWLWFSSWRTWDLSLQNTRQCWKVISSLSLLKQPSYFLPSPKSYWAIPSQKSIAQAALTQIHFILHVHTQATHCNKNPHFRVCKVLPQRLFRLLFTDLCWERWGYFLCFTDHRNVLHTLRSSWPPTSFALDTLEYVPMTYVSPDSGNVSSLPPTLACSVLWVLRSWPLTLDH